MSIFEHGLEPTAVNHIALSPLSFIERTASVYPDYPAVIHGSIRRTWAQTYSRCRRLACALAGRGIGLLYDLGFLTYAAHGEAKVLIADREFHDVVHAAVAMLELDISIMPFFEHEYDSLSDDEKRIFIRLLECDDPDLFNWLMNHGKPADAELEMMVRLIQTRNRERGPVAI